MRLSKYRVWCINKNGWETDPVVLYPNGILEHTNRVGIKTFLQVETHIIQFYTGLTDKNGKEICEGDIVEFCHYDDLITGNDDSEDFPIDAQITAVQNGGTIVGDFDDWNMWTLGFAMDADYVFKIIGNIKENPELLKQPSVSG